MDCDCNIKLNMKVYLPRHSEDRNPDYAKEVIHVKKKKKIVIRLLDTTTMSQSQAVERTKSRRRQVNKSNLIAHVCLLYKCK